MAEQIIASRLDRLLGFLKHDPNNTTLLADAAHVAYEARDLDLASRLLLDYKKITTLTPDLINLTGLIALHSKDYVESSIIFKNLQSNNYDNKFLNFNLSWSFAMQSEYSDALDLLDDETLNASHRAPALKIHMMHHLGMHEAALEEGQRLIERFPDNDELLGALSVLALDSDQAALAQQFAERAGMASYEAVTTLATLCLQAGEGGEALALFDRALAFSPNSPRALLGKGLSLLAAGEARAAAPLLDSAAQLFSSHLGSWLAAGWAYFAQADYVTARLRFETALALNDSFAEIHGSLAAIDAVEGNTKTATRRSAIAHRLDRNSLAAALAASMMMDKAGQNEEAEAIRSKAMTTPIGIDGKTLMEFLINYRPNIKV